MKIHEYQAKEILRQNSVPVPAGTPAFSVDEAVKAAEAMGSNLWVLKAPVSYTHLTLPTILLV